MRRQATASGSSQHLEARRAVRNRILLYSHDGLGLGHLRRTLALAGGLAARLPRAAILVLTSSSHLHAFPLPTNVDAIKLPSLNRRDLYLDVPADRADDATEDIFVVRSAVAEAAFRAFAPHLVLVDQEPAGLAGELREPLLRAHARRPRPMLVAGLRDITYGPGETRRQWHADGTLELLDDVFDRILVYGSREVFDPIDAYGFGTAAAKTTFTGYLRRPESVQPAAAIRQQLGVASQPLVVVSAGGGSDGALLLRTYLRAVREGQVAGVISFVVAGPQYPAAKLEKLRREATSLEHVRLVDFSPDLLSHLAAADVVVTMGGYNSALESIAAGKRPIIVPRADGSEEQRLRAERFAALGVAVHLPPSRLTPATLAEAIQSELHRGVSPAPVLDLGGLDRAVDALVALLGR